MPRTLVFHPSLGAFEGRNVLERCGVEHELRAMVRPDLVEAIGVADVGDHRQAQRAPFVGQ